MTTTGQHFICELWNCDPVALSTKDTLEALAIKAAEATGATVLGTLCHQFSGGGLTIIVLLSESHLSLHTFPEDEFRKYCAVDAFTCGSVCTPSKALPVLIEGLKAQDVSSIRLERGIGPGIESRVV